MKKIVPTKEKGNATEVHDEAQRKLASGHHDTERKAPADGTFGSYSWKSTFPMLIQ